MWKKSIQIISFGNYFMVFLGILLCIETDVQLRLPINKPIFFLLLSESILLYYSYAYLRAIKGFSENQLNERTCWYHRHQKRIQRLQIWRTLVIAATFLYYLPLIKNGISAISPWYIIVFVVILLIGLAYYGLLPIGKTRYLNLRSIGWIKGFIIGLVWAAVVSLFPILDHQVHQDKIIVNDQMLFWFFMKNWMFCSLNAILFDIKDFEDDSNKALKTIVVSMGVKKLLFSFVLPIMLLGVISLVIFHIWAHFSLLHFAINLIPFILMIGITIRLFRSKRSIYYYLFIIDGVLVIKAICGILSTILIQ